MEVEHKQIEKIDDVFDVVSYRGTAFFTVHRSGQIGREGIVATIHAGIKDEHENAIEPCSWILKCGTEKSDRSYSSKEALFADLKEDAEYFLS